MTFYQAQTFPAEKEEIAAWIAYKDDCCAFQDIAWEVRKGSWEKAKTLCKQYRPWFSEYEIQAFTSFGLL